MAPESVPQPSFRTERRNSTEICLFPERSRHGRFAEILFRPGLQPEIAPDSAAFHIFAPLNFRTDMNGVLLSVFQKGVHRNLIARSERRGNGDFSSVDVDFRIGIKQFKIELNLFPFHGGRRIEGSPVPCRGIVGYKASVEFPDGTSVGGTHRFAETGTAPVAGNNEIPPGGIVGRNGSVRAVTRQEIPVGVEGNPQAFSRFFGIRPVQVPVQPSDGGFHGRNPIRRFIFDLCAVCGQRQHREKKCSKRGFHFISC